MVSPITAAAAAPERELNRFVRIMALMERAGNGLGTLVFTWATVVILGGFSTMLTTRKFRYATFLALLEAIRRNDRRQLGWKEGFD
uniref:Uncharacterized protein n=1 Tax=Leersia perrieri TaxID=77586 RepID=A0A0D9X2B6_9ORYZ